MLIKGRDRFSSYAEPYLTRFCIREDYHVSPSPTVCLARHADQRFPQPLPRPSPRSGLLQLRHDPGTLLFGYGGCPPTRRSPRTKARYGQTTPPRVVLRGRRQDRQATPRPRRVYLFRTAVTMGL